MSAGTIARAFSGSWQRWALLALLVFFLLLSIQYTCKTTGTHAERSAILRWQPQVLELDAGVDIWHKYNFPTPPIMALLLRPLMSLPPLACALVWFYLKVGMALLALHWTFQLAEEPGRLFPAWAKLLVVFLSLRPIMGDLIHGNINLFILLLVVGFLAAFHRGRDLAAGLLLALAIACKVTPALFLPYLVWKRAWKTLAGCAAGLVLFFALVPACFLGWERNARDLHSWVDRMVLPFVVKGEVTSEHQNQSLPGLIFRLTTHNPSFATYDEDDHYVPTEYDNVITWDPAVARWLVKGCMVLFAGLVLWTCRTPPAPRYGWRLAAEFSIVVLGMLLFSERTWKHHCVTLVLPFGVLCYYLAVCRPAPALRWYLIGTLAAVFLLISSTSTGLLPDATAKLAQVYGAYVWAHFLLLAALAVLLRWDSVRPAAQSNPFAASQRSASRAAMQPLPAAVTAWR
jgi:hypothetical protein